MKITLRMLADELVDFYPHVLVYGGIESNLRQTALVSASFHISNTACLYCGNVTDLPADIPPDICLLLTSKPTDPLMFQNYIVVQEETDIREIFINVQSILIRILNWRTQILHASVTGEDLQSLLKASTQMFPNEVELLSLFHNQIISSTDVNLHTEHWNRIFRAYSKPGITPKSFPMKDIFDLHMSKVPTTISLPDESGKGMEYMVCNIWLDHIRMGTLFALIPKTQWKKCYSVYLQELALCAATIFRKIHTNPKDGLNGAIACLLRGEGIPPTELSRLCEIEGWAMVSHTFHVSVILATDTVRNVFHNDLLVFRNIISNIYSESKVFLLDDSIVLVRNFTLHEFDEEGSDSLQKLNYMLQRIHAKMGTSLPFSDLSQLFVFYKQANAVAHNTGKMKTPSGEYSCYLVYDIISTFVSTHTSDYYIHPDIRKLVEYDPNGHVGLLHTLYCYLLNDRSYKISAQKQHIHRNSFAYRINKVQDILTCDLNDENTRLSLILSICMFWYTNPEIDPIGISHWKNEDIGEQVIGNKQT